jgi:hypothetical protein
MREKLPQTPKDDALNTLNIEEVTFVNGRYLKGYIAQLSARVKQISQTTLGSARGQFGITPLYVCISWRIPSLFKGL